MKREERMGTLIYKCQHCNTDFCGYRQSTVCLGIPYQHNTFTGSPLVGTGSERTHRVFCMACDVTKRIKDTTKFATAICNNDTISENDED